MKGQITIGIGITVAIFVLGVLGTLLSKVDTKAQGALDKTANLSDRMARVETNVEWIRDSLLAKGFSPAIKSVASSTSYGK